MPGCCEKYGAICRWIQCLLLLCALIFSILAVASCEFVESSANIVGVGDGSQKLGLFGADKGSSFSCQKYDSDIVEENGYLRGARICGLLAAILGIVAFLLILIESCFCHLCCGRCCICTSLTVALICQGCTFLIYAEDGVCTSRSDETIAGVKCEMDTGSIYSIVALVLYLIISCIVCCTPKSEPLFCRKGDDGGDKKAEAAEEEVPKDEEAGKDDVEADGTTPAVAE